MVHSGWAPAPGQAAPKQAADAYAVANQAKLKMGTFLLELCGEPVPAGYDGRSSYTLIY